MPSHALHPGGYRPTRGRLRDLVQAPSLSGTADHEHTTLTRTRTDIHPHSTASSLLQHTATKAVRSFPAAKLLPFSLSLSPFGKSNLSRLWTSRAPKTPLPSYQPLRMPSSGHVFNFYGGSKLRHHLLDLQP
jgi:hypothetical protein